MATGDRQVKRISMYILLVIILILAVGCLIYKKNHRSTNGNARKKLLVICRDDEGCATRLINYELSRSPDISLEEATKRAIESYQRDQ
jgi:hypothetical protein